MPGDGGSLDGCASRLVPMPSDAPTVVACAKLSHATSHVVVSNYDSFLDPMTWPEAEEIDCLRGGE